MQYIWIIWTWIRSHPKKSAAIVLLLLVGAGITKYWLHSVSVAHSEERIIFLGGTRGDDRYANIVLVHGLDGHARETWTADNGFFWPDALAKRFPRFGVWSVAYDAQASQWLGASMPIADRSVNLLTQLRLNKLGNQPIIFVGHSLGGIVIKQMMSDAFTMNDEDWKEIGDQTRGIVFLATPHAGSDIASVLTRLGAAIAPNVTLRELNRNEAALRHLNMWYRDNLTGRGIATGVLYESLPVPPLVVDATSADPGITGVKPIPVQANHKTICKPASEEELTYRYVVDFIERTLPTGPPKWDISFAEFLNSFEKLRNDDLKLQAFMKEHVGQKVAWSATVVKVYRNGNSPSLAIGERVDGRFQDQVLANFSPGAFPESAMTGDKIEIEGIIDVRSSQAGVIISRCKRILSKSR